MRQALIIGYDSELGQTIGKHLEGHDWLVKGTTRRQNRVSREITFLDLSDQNSVLAGVNSLLLNVADWDLLVLSVGQLSPIGKIDEVEYESWKSAFYVNFLNQFLLIRCIIKQSDFLPPRFRHILTFAGSGTNSAPMNFSAYTLAKVSMIKAVELLAAEYPKYIFLSLGTGWMKSPIHQQTLQAGESIGATFWETQRRLRENDFGEPSLLTEFVDWFVNCNNPLVSGRNIALQGDEWKSAEFIEKCLASSDSYKLRIRK